MKLFINVDSNYDPLCIYFLLEEKAAGIDGMTKTLNKENNIKYFNNLDATSLDAKVSYVVQILHATLSFSAYKSKLRY